MRLEVVANKGAGVEILGKAQEECAKTGRVEKSNEYIIADVGSSNSLPILSIYSNIILHRHYFQLLE